MQSLTVPAVLDSLSTIGKAVLAAAAEAGLTDKASYRLRLAVDEIATNVITHGYGGSPSSDLIAVHFDLGEASLTVTVEDSGPAFDPTQLAPPADIHLPPEQRQIGGLGVYLALQGVDRFRYERAGDRNRNIFIVNRPASSATA